MGIMKAQLAADPNLTAVSVAYEPDADGRDAASISGEGALPAVPGLPWAALLAIPPAAGALAWAAAQATVRRALRGLP
jgi:hypothetical protein